MGLTYCLTVSILWPRVVVLYREVPEVPIKGTISTGSVSTKFTRPPTGLTYLEGTG